MSSAKCFLFAHSIRGSNYDCMHSCADQSFQSEYFWLDQHLFKTILQKAIQLKTHTGYFCWEGVTKELPSNDKSAPFYFYWHMPSIQQTWQACLMHCFNHSIHTVKRVLWLTWVFLPVGDDVLDEGTVAVKGLVPHQNHTVVFILV